MSNTIASVRAAEVSLGIGRQPLAKPRDESTDASATVPLTLILGAGAALRALLLFLGPLGDPSRSMPAESAAVLSVAAGISGNGLFGAATPDGAASRVIEQFTPMYPAFVSMTGALGLATAIVLLLQIAMAVACGALAFQIARDLCGSVRAGLVAAGVMTLHPAGMVASLTLMPETMGVLLLLAGLRVAVWRERRDLTTGILGGVITGVAMLTLPLSWMTGVALATWILVSDRRLRGAVGAVGFAVGSLAAPAFWCMRNNGAGMALMPDTSVLPGVGAAWPTAVEPLVRLATAHDLGSLCGRVGVRLGEPLPITSLLDVTQPVTLTGTIILALLWIAIAAAAVALAPLGGLMLAVHGRWSSLLLGLLLAGVTLLLLSQATGYRAQALALPGASLLVAAMFAAATAGQPWWKRKPRPAAETAEEPEAAATGRPL